MISKILLNLNIKSRLSLKRLSYGRLWRPVSNGMKKIILTNLYLLGTTFALKAFGSRHNSGGVDTGEGSNVNKIGELPNPLKIQSITELLNRIINALNFIIPPIAVLMVIVGAFQILTAGGAEDKYKTGKRTITYAVIGIAIFLLAKLLIDLITELLGAGEPSPAPFD